MLKHSGSDPARVVLAPLPPHGLRVAVSDEGSATAAFTGSGLAGLRDRVEALGGGFRLQATPAVGHDGGGRVHQRELEAVPVGGGV